MAAPDDFGARDVRQAFTNRINESVAGVVERLRDDPARDLVAFRRHHRAQPREACPAAGEIAAGRECGQQIGSDDRLQPILQIPHAPSRSQQLGTPAVHRPAMTTVNFEQQPVLGLEMIGHAAGICAGGVRDVANRDRVETVGREQFFRGTQDRLTHDSVCALQWAFLRVGLVTIYLYQCTKDKVRSTKIMGVSTKPSCPRRCCSAGRSRRVDRDHESGQYEAKTSARGCYLHAGLD